MCIYLYWQQWKNRRYSRLYKWCWYRYDTEKNPWWRKKNRHGESFIHFLLECKLCIVNGRVSPEFDNFTSKGRSVVDYICVQHNCIDKCIAFRVHDTNQLLSDFHLQGLIGDGCKPPDHALLELIYDTTIFNEPAIDPTETSENNRRRYKFSNISNDFMATPVWSSVCDALIQRIDVMEHSQSEIINFIAICAHVFLKKWTIT